MAERAGNGAGEPTVVDHAAPTSGLESASIESAVTAEQALTLFEARRVRVYAIGLVVASAIGIALALGVGGDRQAQLVHVIALAATLVGSAGYVLATRRPADYRRWKVTAMVYVGLLANASGFYYYGVFSAYAGVVTMSAYGRADRHAARARRPRGGPARRLDRGARPRAS